MELASNRNIPKACREAFGMLCPPLVKHSIHLIPSVLFASQIQEAASRGLKFVGVIPQYHCPVNSAGGSPLVDVRGAETEPGGGGNKKNPGAPAEVDGSPEPNQGPTGETPIAEQPSLPLEEEDGSELPKTLGGPDGDASEVRGEPLSGSKYVSAGTFDPWEKRLTAFQQSHGILGKRNRIRVCRDSHLSNRRNSIKRFSGPPDC